MSDRVESKASYLSQSSSAACILFLLQRTCSQEVNWQAFGAILRLIVGGLRIKDPGKDQTVTHNGRYGATLRCRLQDEEIARCRPRGGKQRWYVNSTVTSWTMSELLFLPQSLTPFANSSRDVGTAYLHFVYPECGPLAEPMLTSVAGKFKYHNAIGPRSPAHDATHEAMRTDAVFWTASCTKLMTAVAAMHCVERGLIGLDDDVSELLWEQRNQNILTGFDAKGTPVLEPCEGIMTLRYATSSFPPPAFKCLNIYPAPCVELQSSWLQQQHYVV